MRLLRDLHFRTLRHGNWIILHPEAYTAGGTFSTQITPMGTGTLRMGRRIKVRPTERTKKGKGIHKRKHG